MTEATSNAVQTRQALLDAARELFSTRGYEGVGIREIADSAGANIASINYYFGSKQALYLETVREAMAHAEEHSPWTMLRSDVPDAESAAVMLAGFVRGYVAQLGAGGRAHAGATPPGRPACGRLMLWEAIHPSEAIDDVVRDYIAPSQLMLDGLVRRLLGDVDNASVRLHARSVLGQVMHYLVFRPFIERLDRGESDAAEDIADHIVRFSLRAMGHDDAFVERILERAPMPVRTQETQL